MRRLLTICLFLVLLIYLFNLGVKQDFLRVPTLPPLLITWINQAGFKLTVKPIALPLLPETSPGEITQKINTYRLSHDLSELLSDSVICQFTPSGSTDTFTSQFLKKCPTCTHVALITVSRFVSPNELLTIFINDDSTNQTLLASQSNLLCVQENGANLLFFFATQKDQASVPVVLSPQALKPPPKITAGKPKNFTESELWQALAEYRKAHGRTTLTLDEALCTYARKRLNDHLTLMDQKKPEEYPVPEKYPLDAHTGFSADADSGLAFDMAGKSQLAENLAYWPDAQYPHQVIEWGWDSSTEGHREAQLSNDWTSGCISHQNGFYVAIFGS